MTKKDKYIQKQGDHDGLELVLLRATNNDYELNLIRGLLDDNDIPYILKEKGIGGYMRIIGGQSLYGTDILVEESLYEKATLIIGGFIFDE